MRNPLLIIILFFLYGGLFAQDTGQPVPKSWLLNLPDTPNVISFQPIDLFKVQQLDEINDQDKSGPWRFGIERPVSLDSQKDGTWSRLSDGGQIWRLKVHSPNALNLSLVFDSFYLPQGSRLQIYNDQRDVVAQTFYGSEEKNSEGIGTWFTEGDVIWVEYYQPASVKGKARLHIKSIVHGYRLGSVNTANVIGSRINGSGKCNYDVNCPIGEDFDDLKNILKKSVAFVNLGNGFLCTAVLVNNTKGDKTPYLLTANHAVLNSNPALWSFRFNWVSPNPVCGTGDASSDLNNNFTVSGARLIANNRLSDFALVKLQRNIPDSWDVVFAGWDNSDEDPLFEVGIHHPKGDIMKVCRDDSGAQKTNANGTEVWLIGGGKHGTGNGWEIGTTEGGSSGSPLFNQNGKIIGQLYAGESGCNGKENNNEYDIYGRFAVSWSAGEHPEARLMDWLDPDFSGQSSIGILQNALNVPTFQPINEIQVYPNPASATIHVRNDKHPQLSFRLINMVGQEILSGSVANSLNSISVEDLSEGLYLLQLMDPVSDDSIVKKIVIKRY